MHHATIYNHKILFWLEKLFKGIIKWYVFRVWIPSQNHNEIVPKHTKSTWKGDQWRMQKKRSKPISPIRVVEEDVKVFNRFDYLSDLDDETTMDPVEFSPQTEKKKKTKATWKKGKSQKSTSSNYLYSNAADAETSVDSVEFSP